MYKLERMLWQQVRDIVPSQIDTAVLPIGTIEAHGAACLGTDVFIPEDISEYVCEKFNYINNNLECRFLKIKFTETMFA